MDNFVNVCLAVFACLFILGCFGCMLVGAASLFSSFTPTKGEK